MRARGPVGRVGSNPTPGVNQPGSEPKITSIHSGFREGFHGLGGEKG